MDGGWHGKATRGPAALLPAGRWRLQTTATSVWLWTVVASDRGAGQNGPFMAQVHGSATPARWRVAWHMVAGGDGALTSVPPRRERS
jgi:hypothetical protein